MGRPRPHKDGAGARNLTRSTDLAARRLLSPDEAARYLGLGSRWAIRRLLEYGEWEEIWRYLTHDDVEPALPGLRLRTPELDSFWRVAVARWRPRAA